MDKKDWKAHTNKNAYHTKTEGLLMPEDMEEGIRESLPALSNFSKKQGEFTVDDLQYLPEDERYELIDGVLYQFSSPSYIHQAICGELYFQLSDFIGKNHGKCLPFTSPADVRLDKDIFTMLQPDVFVVCDRDSLYQRVLWGAPDFVVEILSKSTARKDRIIKLRKYREAGVREYWMVDPEQKRVVVHHFGKEDVPTIYGFDDCIPVGIFEGKCEIDFIKIYENIAFLYEKEEDPYRK